MLAARGCVLPPPCIDLSRGPPYMLAKFKT